MPLIPKVMSTQHPDNATPPAFATNGVVKGQGEIIEAVEVFDMGCDEQMWDSEGKEADRDVVQKLLSNYVDFFKHERKLGQDCILTLRVPNPAIEIDMRKSMVEALQGIPTAWDVTRSFYGGKLDEAPIQEVILPFTTSAQELARIDDYYTKFIVGQETQSLTNGYTVQHWIGEFFPKRIRVIPLIEDLEHQIHSDQIVREYLQGREVPYQRVFLARSDPALNYGVLSADLMLKIALDKLDRLEGEIGVPIYPIVGVGSVPFRGHLTPHTVERAFTEYPSVQTYTVQSAFKYDYDKESVRSGIRQLLAHERGEPVHIDVERARRLIDKFTAEYQARVKQLAALVQNVSRYVPRRRERKLHVGLFGYGRTLGNAGEVTLPRAISFCASLYSIGVPPELLGLVTLDDEDMRFLRDVYPSFQLDLNVALRYMNEERVRELLGDEYLKAAHRFDGNGVDRVHEGLTTAVWAGMHGSRNVNVSHYLEEAAQLRRFLG